MNRQQIGKSMYTYVVRLVHAYNAKVHESTWFSPFYLMFGYFPRLPIDVVVDFPESSENQDDYDSYIPSLWDQLSLVYKFTSREAKASVRKQKQNYDCKVAIHHLILGIEFWRGKLLLKETTSLQVIGKVMRMWLFLSQLAYSVKEYGKGEKVLHSNFDFPFACSERS